MRIRWEVRWMVEEMIRWRGRSVKGVEGKMVVSGNRGRDMNGYVL